MQYALAIIFWLLRKDQSIKITGTHQFIVINNKRTSVEVRVGQLQQLAIPVRTEFSLINVR